MVRTLYRYNGGLLRVSGSLATAAACCCAAAACDCNADAADTRVSVRIETNHGTVDTELTRSGSIWEASIDFTTEHGISAATTDYTIWAEAECVSDGAGGYELEATLYCSDGGATIGTGSANNWTPPSCGDTESYDPSDIDIACSLAAGEGGDTIYIQFCATCDGTDPATQHTTLTPP